MNKALKTYLLHIGLFIATFFSTTLAGGYFIHSRMWLYTDYSWTDFTAGLHFSIPFLLILTTHEFGHYFTARYHKVNTTLPFYIPFPPFPGSIGTMGALIRIKSRVQSNIQHFDIGIAGPLAGFVVAVGFLWYGYTHLPPAEYIFEIHPEYKEYGLNYADHVYSLINPENDIKLGKPLLMRFFEAFIVTDATRVPNAHEMMHYPYLFAGFLALLFTALNLLPIGQLDGGHILYGLVGRKKHKIVATVFYIAFLFYAGLGYLSPYDSSNELMLAIPLYTGFLFIALKGFKLSNQQTLMYALMIFAVQFTLPLLNSNLQGYPGWLLFVFIVGRFVGIYHPPSPIEEPLDRRRVILGWLSLLIFIISFSPAPIVIG